MMRENCQVCNGKTEYGVQIGKGKNAPIFCNICAPIIAIGIKLIEKTGFIKICN